MPLGQRKGVCGHFVAAYDSHDYCPACRQCSRLAPDNVNIITCVICRGWPEEIWAKFWARRTSESRRKSKSSSGSASPSRDVLSLVPVSQNVAFLNQASAGDLSFSVYRTPPVTPIVPPESVELTLGGREEIEAEDQESDIFDSGLRAPLKKLPVSQKPVQPCGAPEAPGLAFVRST